MTRASDLAKLLGAGATINDGTTITTADNDPQLILKCTDTDASTGPKLDLERNPGEAGADGDNLAQINFYGYNDASEKTQYLYLFAEAADVANGSEDVRFGFGGLVAGADSNIMTFTHGTSATGADPEIVFNDSSKDINFRVESNGNANMLFVNGGNDTVGIGHSGSTATLDVRVAGTASLGIGSTNASGASIYLDGDSNGDFSGSDYSYITHDSAGRLNIIQDSPSGTNHLRLYTAASERFRIDGDGAVSIHTLGVNPVSQSGNTDAGGTFFANAAYIAFARIGGVVSYFNRQYSDGDVIAIRQDGSDEGTISVSGTTVSYNAFSGSHWSRLIDNSKPTVLKGTVIETIDEMCDWYQVKITIPKTEDSNERTIKDSIALPEGKKVGDTISHTYEDVTYDDAVIIKEGDNKHPKCKISDTADSKRIYGVHADWDNDDDTVNDMYVTAVGTHVVRINKDVTVSAGDLLSSNGDGTAKVQDDDIIRSKTIGKVLTNLKQETYSDGSYTVPCALYCG